MTWKIAIQGNNQKTNTLAWIRKWKILWQIHIHIVLTQHVQGVMELKHMNLYIIIFDIFFFKPFLVHSLFERASWHSSTSRATAKRTEGREDEETKKEDKTALASGGPMRIWQQIYSSTLFLSSHFYCRHNRQEDKSFADWMPKYTCWITD